MQKTWDIGSFNKYWWWKNPVILLDKGTFWSKTGNYVNWIYEKNALIYLEIN